MDIDIEKLKSKLENHIVLVTFESLKSGKTYSREYTLSDKHCDMPIHIKKQNGDKLICYDVEFKKWEDLQVDTIREFKVVE